MTALTGLAYPLAVTGVAQIAFPWQANGSLIVREGRVIGSELIGQNFTSDRYFHGRPSATQGSDPADPARTVSLPYNAQNSAGSNAGPTAKSLINRVRDDVAIYRGAHGADSLVPADAVTTSASGLDPDVSPDNAASQIARVARVRELSEERIHQLVAAASDDRTLGFLGEPRVNILVLNLALDREKSAVADR